jgi:hypothetical protein
MGVTPSLDKFLGAVPSLKKAVASPGGFDTRYPDNFEGIWVSDHAA